MTTTTFAHQGELPRLPIPQLHDTIRRYLVSVAPLLSPEEFQATAMKCLEFMAPGGVGETLQARLVQRAKDKGDSSWLIDWWRHYAYLAFRMSVVINVSYFYQFRDTDRKGCTTQVGRAAELALGVAAFRDRLATGTLPPDMAGKSPLCMSMYRYIYNTCRVPAPDRDEVRSFELRGNTDILVVRKNRFFVVNLGEADARIGKLELETHLNSVIQAADALPSVPPVGVLTGANRDLWAEALPHLLEDPTNKASFSALASTMFALCLDTEAPAEPVEVARMFLHGNGRNRWYDKSMQFIVLGNGKAGMLGEHSMSDGMPTAAACNWILAGLDKGAVPMAGVHVADRPPPRRLDFVVTPTVQRYMARASAEFDAMIADHSVACLNFDTYGREAIKGFKLSPDAFAQMAIQLAYYRTFGRVRGTYEPAHTRKFLHGRTECIRVATSDVVAWVKSMGDAGVGRAEKRALLGAAVKTHSGLTRAALQGQGVDRHLFGLKRLVGAEEPTPALFEDPAFATSSTWAVSTSNLTSEHFENWGWGEVVPDGIGVAYSTLKHRLQFNVTALNATNPAKFVANLRQALLDMATVCTASRL